MKGDQDSFECKKRINNSLTIIFNGLSLLFSIAAIILLVIFMSKTL